MEQPILIYQKNADKNEHKVIIPKIAIDKFGYSYYMEIYEDKIVMKPINQELKKNKENK